MNGVYASVLRPLLFALPAESAHGLAAVALRTLHRHPTLRACHPGPVADPALSVRVFGKTFTSPVGVAAGFDKSAEMYNALGALGFAFVEVGTVTAIGQPGNPRPRMFRLPMDHALVNRMGFNNPGAEAVARSLAQTPPTGVLLGINLGKSKLTPLAHAADDYATSARLLAPFADYLVVNVSSPNTPGLRSLQSVDALVPITRAVRSAAGDLPPAILVKLAPDLADEDLDAVADMAVAEGLAGIVATNTTMARTGLASPHQVISTVGAGGLSGAPLRERSTAVIARIRRRVGNALTILGAGGVSTPEHAWDKLRAGASLVQVYTGFVYKGPTLPRDLTEGIRVRLDAGGYTSVAEVVGSGAHEM